MGNKKKLCVEGVVQRKDRGKEKEKWKRLNRGVKCTIKLKKRRTWKSFFELTGRLQRKREAFICSNEE
jgi:hypothetical protein